MRNDVELNQLLRPKTLASYITPTFLPLALMSNPSGTSVGSTIKIYSEFTHFFFTISTAITLGKATFILAYVTAVTSPDPLSIFSIAARLLLLMGSGLLTIPVMFKHSTALLSH